MPLGLDLHSTLLFLLLWFSVTKSGIVSLESVSSVLQQTVSSTSNDILTHHFSAALVSSFEFSQSENKHFLLVWFYLQTHMKEHQTDSRVNVSNANPALSCTCHESFICCCFIAQSELPASAWPRSPSMFNICIPPKGKKPEAAGAPLCQIQLEPSVSVRISWITPDALPVTTRRFPSPVYTSTSEDSSSQTSFLCFKIWIVFYIIITQKTFLFFISLH